MDTIYNIYKKQGQAPNISLDDNHLTNDDNFEFGDFFHLSGFDLDKDSEGLLDVFDEEGLVQESTRSKLTSLCSFINNINIKKAFAGIKGNIFSKTALLSLSRYIFNSIKPFIFRSELKNISILISKYGKSQLIISIKHKVKGYHLELLYDIDHDKITKFVEEILEPDKPKQE